MIKDIMYANNDPYQISITFSLSYPDWCRMKSKAWFPKLERFLARHETPESRDSLSEEQDSEETSVCGIEVPQIHGFGPLSARMDKARDLLLSKLMRR